MKGHIRVKQNALVLPQVKFVFTVSDTFKFQLLRIGEVWGKMKLSESASPTLGTLKSCQQAQHASYVLTHCSKEEEKEEAGHSGGE